MLLFLDVDGPLIPFRARPGSPIAPSPDSSGNPLIGGLDPTVGAKLLALGCDLVWATTWMADANEVVSPRLGIPALPIVEFPDDAEAGRGVHWKTGVLVQWAAGRSFVWLDDEITDADREWVAAAHPGDALLHRVDPLIGLTDGDFEVVGRWLGERGR